MTIVRDVLKDADPVDREGLPREADRDRVRSAVIAAASRGQSRRRAVFRAPLAILGVAAAVLITLGAAAIGPHIWERGATLHAAALRFEVRLGEERPGPGLLEAAVGESKRLVYLHPDVIVDNADIVETRVVETADPSRFEVRVQFTSDGAQRMRTATEGHIGKPLAIVIDGKVVMAPVVRSPISDSAVVTGGYTKSEAERIAQGIAIR